MKSSCRNRTAGKGGKCGDGRRPLPDVGAWIQSQVWFVHGFLSDIVKTFNEEERSHVIGKLYERNFSKGKSFTASHFVIDRATLQLVLCGIPLAFDNGRRNHSDFFPLLTQFQLQSVLVPRSHAVVRAHLQCTPTYPRSTGVCRCRARCIRTDTPRV